MPRNNGWGGFRLGEEGLGEYTPIPALHEQGTSISVFAKVDLPVVDGHSLGANTMHRSRRQ